MSIRLLLVVVMKLSYDDELVAAVQFKAEFSVFR